MFYLNMKFLSLSIGGYP